MPARATVEHEGQSFALAQSSVAANVETDEYILAGEKLATWTQLVTVQRLTLVRSAAADEFLTYFGKKVAADGGSFEILSRGRPASIFAVRFPRTSDYDEQVMVCLALSNVAKPTELNIVQYAIKPGAMPEGTAESHLKSWRDRFVRQAKAAETVASSARG